MTHYEIISKNTDSTVVAKYESDGKRAKQYESEAALEHAFIEQLEKQAYEAGSPYRLVTCRIRRWQKAKFIAAVAALKEYTVTAGYHDYADQCDQRIQGQSESYQVNLQLKPSIVA